MEIGFTVEDFGEVIDFRERMSYSTGEPRVIAYTCLVKHINGNIVMATWHEPAARWGFSTSNIKWKDPIAADKWWRSHLEAVEFIEAKHKKEWEESREQDAG